MIGQLCKSQTKYAFFSFLEILQSMHYGPRWPDLIVGLGLGWLVFFSFIYFSLLLIDNPYNTRINIICETYNYDTTTNSI